MMDRILGPILQGIPPALVAGIIILWFINPIDTKVERVMNVMNREVIPLINELKEGRIQSPPVQPLTERLKVLEKGIAELNSEIQNVRASIDDVKQFSLVASSLGPTLPAVSPFKTGDVIYAAAWTTMSQKPIQYNLKVTNPTQLNKIRSELVNALEKAGVKVIIQPGRE